MGCLQGDFVIWHGEEACSARQQDQLSATPEDEQRTESILRMSKKMCGLG